MSFGEVLQTVFVIYGSFLGARRLMELDDLVQVRLSRKVKRLLFIVPIDHIEVNLCAFLWQCITHITVLVILMDFIGVMPFVNPKQPMYVYVVLEWVFIFLPLAIYAIIVQLINKRK